MSLYAESSAILAWLLGEEASGTVRRHLADADSVITSELTLIECERVLIRAVVAGQTTEVAAAERTSLLAAAAARWVVLQLAGEVVERARRPFPSEPVRTLDALHLASALLARSAVDDLAVLSLDDQLRANARALGFETLP